MDQDGKIKEKISGYLEMKVKKKMISSYKKYWFVLEGRLLLYYRSKDEYEAISPCKGSVNLGPSCTVKPCSSMSGAFQVETRTTTITLRAINRQDQNRWMQGIMSAISPNKNSLKLSHFRYSSDELFPPQESQAELQSKYSTPIEEKSVLICQSNHQEIIQRLQKLGAKSYEVPLATQPKTTLVNAEKSDCGEARENVGDHTSRKSMLNENPKYIYSSEYDKGGSLDIREKTNYTSDVYERITQARSAPSNINHYIVPEIDKQDTKKNNKDAVCGTLRLKSIQQLNRPTTYILENDTYDISIKLKESKLDADDDCRQTLKKTENVCRQNESPENKNINDSIMVQNETYAEIGVKEYNIKNDSPPSNLIIENDEYLSTNEVDILSNLSEAIYSDISETMDHNKNNLNSHTADSQKPDSNIKSIIYEEMPEYWECSEGKLNDGYISENHKKEYKSKIKTEILKNKEKEIKKFGKKPSFMRRIWKRKDKRKQKENDKQIEEEELYETVPNAAVEKMAITDAASLQLLFELQNILEHKLPSIVKRLPDNPSSPTNSPHSRTNEEDKKEHKINEEAVNDVKGETSEPVIPLIPTKIQKTNISSPYHDVPKNNKPVTPPLKTTQKETKIKTIDEILYDLGGRKNDETANTVKHLIKRFSEPELLRNKVALRTHRESSSSREEIDSDELNRLLDELSKVTNAPLLIPGYTSSLIAPTPEDEELSRLLPARRRSNSESDYDIPRPHMSLLNLPRREDAPENMIQSTRFFGPILKPRDLETTKKGFYAENSLYMKSITPDSLEADIHRSASISQNSDEDNLYEPKLEKTDTSQYVHFTFKKPPIDEVSLENDLYAEPNLLNKLRSFRSSKTSETDIPGCNKINYDNKEDEVFVDSLEFCNTQT